MTRRIALAALLLTLAAAPAPADNLDLPDLGDPSGAALSAQEEARLGQAFMRQLRASRKVLDDPLWSGYIQNLGNRLAAHSDQASASFTFFLIKDSEVNAFAGPAGHIGIHTGLVLATESEAELASVLAHEMAAGRVEALHVPVNCLDVLAQQMVATVAGATPAAKAQQSHDGISEEALWHLMRGAYPYRNLTPKEYEQLLEMPAEQLGLDSLDELPLDRDF